MNGLKRVGCRTAPQSFGSTFTAIGHLKDLPWDFLILNGSYASKLAESRPSQHMVQAIVSVARGIGAQTIATCIDTGESLEIFRQLGVDYEQGYHVGYPQPQDSVLAGFSQ